MDYAKTSPVVLFKLLNGQELVGTVIAEDENGWTLAKSREIVPQQTPTGQVVLALAPAIMMNGKLDVDVELLRTAVAIILHKLPNQFEEEYLSATSGIQIAKVV